MLIAGWDFWPKRFLEQGNFKSVLVEHVKNMVTVKLVDVRVLAFKNPIRLVPRLLSDPAKFVDEINAFNKQPNNPIAFLDGRTGGGIVSHHQKLVFIGNKQVQARSIAYVGGMDLAADRRDTIEHKKKLDEKEDQFFAWHDIQLKVKGDATTQIWASFAERWDNHITRGIELRAAGDGGHERFTVPSEIIDPAAMHRAMRVRLASRGRSAHIGAFPPEGTFRAAMRRSRARLCASSNIAVR
jgi:phosphatidylserine/phosphatidylglycerophosphate/cardiolipin synthase-like enzyme